MNDAEKRAAALATLDDLVGRFVYYDRKEDEDLQRGDLERLVREGTLTVDEMVAAFEMPLRAYFAGQK